MNRSCLIAVVLLLGTSGAGLTARAQQAPPAGAPPTAAEPAPADPTGTQTATIPVQTPPRRTRVAPDYIIGPGDALDVNVYKEPTVSGQVPVRPDGMISLPLISDIPAAGETPVQLGQEITTRLKKYITDPTVTVTVTAVNSKRIYLIGEVGKPGEMTLTPGLSPLQAIAAAGGLSTFANGKKVYILRGSAPGKQQKIPFNYKKALKDGNLQGVTLLAGDTIVVP